MKKNLIAVVVVVLVIIVGIFVWLNNKSGAPVVKNENNTGKIS